MREIEGRNGGRLKIPEKGETNNPHGRPKKSFSLLNTQLKKEGYEPLTKSQLMEAYSLLLSIDEVKIQEIADDDKQPLAIRLIIAEMTNEQSRGRALADMRDYLFGKSESKLSVEVKEQPLFPESV